MSAGSGVAVAGSAEAGHAAARSRAYAVFAELLDYPDAWFCDAVRGGAVADALREVLAAVDPPLAAGDFAALAEAGPEDELAVEYTRLFDVGAGGPPCPLYGGAYGGARMKAMEECVRFYHHFGLALSEAPRELPDHLVTQLEFLHYLAYREAELLARGEDAGDYRRAARDFAQRHPGRFVPKLQARLAGARAMPFYRELAARLAGFLAHDLARLVALEGPGPPASAAPPRPLDGGGPLAQRGGAASGESGPLAV
jgi:DMSO reductase family type II enzyme chaperone